MDSIGMAFSCFSNPSLPRICLCFYSEKKLCPIDPGSPHQLAPARAVSATVFRVTWIRSLSSAFQNAMESVIPPRRKLDSVLGPASNAASASLDNPEVYTITGLREMYFPIGIVNPTEITPSCIS